MRYMAATDEIVYRGWFTFRFGNQGARTTYFGPYSLEKTAKGVVTQEIRSYRRHGDFVLIARGVHEARFEWKPVETTVETAEDDGS